MERGVDPLEQEDADDLRELLGNLLGLLVFKLLLRDEVADPYIYLGFQRPPTRQDLKTWIEEQNIAAVKSCFDRIPVKPGELLHIKAEIVSSQSRLARIKASTERDGALVASAELLFCFETKGKLGLPDIDPVLVDYWDRTKTGKQV